MPCTSSTVLTTGPPGKSMNKWSIINVHRQLQRRLPLCACVLCVGCVCVWLLQGPRNHSAPVHNENLNTQIRVSKLHPLLKGTRGPWRNGWLQAETRTILCCQEVRDCLLDAENVPKARETGTKRLPVAKSETIWASKQKRTVTEHKSSNRGRSEFVDEWVSDCQGRASIAFCRMVTSKPRRKNAGNCDRGDKFQRVTVDGGWGWWVEVWWGMRPQWPITLEYLLSNHLTVK